MHKNCKKCKRSKRNSEEFQWTCKRNALEFQKKFTRKCCHCVQNKKNDEKMACLMNFFWNYAAVLLRCSCSFYRIEFFSKIDSNLIKQRKRSSHVYHFFSNQLPSFAQHWLQLNLNLPKQIPGYFDPAAQVKPNPTHVNPSRSYISMQQINAIIFTICYYSFRPPHLKP